MGQVDARLGNTVFIRITTVIPRLCHEIARRLAANVVSLSIVYFGNVRSIEGIC